jgi:peptide/nickel transport system substrate-binding protein
VRRFASLGIALVLAVGTLVPIAHAQAQGKTVVLAFSQEPDTFVGGEGGEYVTQVVADLVYGNCGTGCLVGIDDQMRPQAELATDIPTLDNGEAVMVGDGADQHLETTFHIRQNATWSDGTPVTADDVIFSWKMSLNAAWPAQAGNDVESKYANVIAKDTHTVVFQMMSQNQARAAGNVTQQGPVIHPFYLYGLPDVWLYPSKRFGPLVDFDPQNSPKVANLQSSVYGRQPIGAGPYTLDSWDPGVQMVLHARADYFRGKPAIDTIIVRGFNTDKETLLSQLQAGDVQTIGSETLDVSDVDAINAIPGVKAYVRAGTTVEHLDFNLTNPILADKQVRKAIAFAIDKQDLVNRVLAGQPGLVANSWIPPISPLFNPDTPGYQFNPDQARQILDSDGWTVGSDGVRVNSSGQRLSFKYQSTNNAIRKKTMPLVKDQLAAVGIELNIDQMPAQTWFGKPGPLVQGTYDVGEYADVGTQDSGVDVVTKFGSKFAPTAANNFAGQNFMHYSSSTADQLIATESGSLVPAARQSAMFPLQLLLADDLPMVTLYYRPNVTAATNRLANWQPEYAANGYTWNAWQWDLR